jgi:hypothetical protein
MPFPNIDPSIETFLEPTRILLFGKPFPTLRYDPNPMIQPAPGRESEFEPYASVPAGADLPMPPGRVEQALRLVGDQGIFARIYGFSHEGSYYKMPRPVLFLVRGEGVRQRAPEDPLENGATRFTTRFTGVEAKDWHFGTDIRVWAVDKHDIAVRLDIEIGDFDQVLLQSLAAGRDESAFRSHGYARGAANFQSRMFGPHQER